MNKIKNKERVSLIVMKPTACIFCHIGQDWYNCQFKACFAPGEFYPDYMEVQDFVSREIDGKELNIEQAAHKLVEFLKEYEPTACSVTAHVEGCKTHFDVDVTVA